MEETKNPYFTKEEIQSMGEILTEFCVFFKNEETYNLACDKVDMIMNKEKTANESLLKVVDIERQRVCGNYGAIKFLTFNVDFWTENMRLKKDYSMVYLDEKENEIEGQYTNCFLYAAYKPVFNLHSTQVVPYSRKNVKWHKENYAAPVPRELIQADGLPPVDPTLPKEELETVMCVFPARYPEFAFPSTKRQMSSKDFLREVIKSKEANRKKLGTK